VEVHAYAGSDRHDPHGIEHKAEEEAIQGKFEHGALPQSDRPFGHLTTKTTGLNVMVNGKLRPAGGCHSGMRFEQED
jgi:hypothetical protein